MPKTLILSAHRTPNTAVINKALVNALKDLPDVTLHELSRAYPDYKIDVAREHQLLDAHQRLVMMFPFYWYSSPAILSEWQDAVLTYGYAYGSEGNALQGKTLQLVVSTGGNEQAYTAEGYNRYPVESLLLPFHAMANRTGMHYAAPLLLQGANSLTDSLLEKHVDAAVRLVSHQSSLLCSQ